MSRAHYAVGPLAAGTSPRQDNTALAGEVERQLDAVNRLFQAWQAEADSKRLQALATRGFNSGRSFELALLVFNKRGERRKGARKVQDWYFATRQHITATVSQPCARCCVCVSRRDIYYVDKAKDWKKADELCRHCMQCVMRQLLGEDDAAILEEARHIMDSEWSPVINSRLADALVDSRTFFSML